jgi:dihydrofolate synthase/folylpolyglutamate synthase
MEYQEALDYMYGLYPDISNKGWDAYKPGLERMEAMAQAVHNPHAKYPVIHIAGTNGKGSVSHMLSAVLQSAGFKVGLFSSPHLVDFNERIKINGLPIPHKEVIEYVKMMGPMFEKHQPSFFEFTNLMAFQYFMEEEVDVAIIETGLGGRLDSTNIVEPILSIITNIGWDHQKFLGNTLESIAGEKSGIMKRNTPCVIGKRQKEIADVFVRKAEELDIPVTFASDKIYDLVPMDLGGHYQKENQQTVLAAVEWLNQLGWEIDGYDVAEGIRNVIEKTNFKGRWQIINKHPLVIADTAHNRDGIQKVVDQLSALNRKVYMILGFAKDKDVSEILQMLPQEFYYCLTSVDNPRMMPLQDLINKSKLHQLRVLDAPNPIEAYKRVIAVAEKRDVIFIGGSNYVVGEFLKNYHPIFTGVS